MSLEHNLSKLPEQCYTVPDSTSKLILLKRGETGYYETTLSTKNEAENRALAKELNAKLGVTPEQEQAMLFGSLFGWNLPGADPDFYAMAEQTASLEPNDDERAYSLNGGEYYFFIQTYEDGYDYTIYHRNYWEFDGGQYDDTSITMDEAIKLILEEYDLQDLSRAEYDIDDLRQKTDEVAQARYDDARAKLTGATLETRMNDAKVRSTQQQGSAEKSPHHKEHTRDE